MYSRPLILSFIFLFAIGCAPSTQKLVESGDYDEALDVALRRLVGKSRKKKKDILTLEEAFARANAEDLRRIDAEVARADADYTVVYDLYRRVDRRQESIRPLLPLEATDGYRARIEFADTVEPLAEYAERAAGQVYAEALELLERARGGDKQAGRLAYSELERIDYYVSNYRDTYRLMEQAEELGQLFVLITVENRSGAIIPERIEREMLYFPVENVENDWVNVDNEPRPGRVYDYDARFAITEIDISGENQRETSYDEEETITERQYVYDSDGNVRKDSLGNDIRREVKTKVRAQVVGVEQLKTINIAAEYELFDRRRGVVLDRDRVYGGTYFENAYGTFRGDERALSRRSREMIEGRALPFPTDQNMLLDAIAELREELLGRMLRSSSL